MGNRTTVRPTLFRCLGCHAWSETPPPEGVDYLECYGCGEKMVPPREHPLDGRPPTVSSDHAALRHLSPEKRRQIAADHDPQEEADDGG